MSRQAQLECSFLSGNYAVWTENLQQTFLNHEEEDTVTRYQQRQNDRMVDASVYKSFVPEYKDYCPSKSAGSG